jgi:hypothetical protein
MVHILKEHNFSQNGYFSSNAMAAASRSGFTCACAGFVAMKAGWTLQEASQLTWGCCNSAELTHSRRCEAVAAKDWTSGQTTPSASNDAHLDRILQPNRARLLPADLESVARQLCAAQLQKCRAQ